MKITKTRLKQIINEELEQIIESAELDEGFFDRMKARVANLGAKSSDPEDGNVKAIKSLRKSHAAKLKKIQQTLKRAMLEALQDGRTIGLSDNQVKAIIFDDLQTINTSLTQAIERMAAGND